jgi:hypothetical protein
MARRISKNWLLLAPSLVLVAAVPIAFKSFQQIQPPADIGQTLNLSGVLLGTHLYPARSKDEMALLIVPPDRAIDVRSPDPYAPVKRFVRGLDGSREDDGLQSDGHHKESALSFYRVSSLADVPKPRVLQEFAPGSDIVIAEQRWRLDQTLAYKMTGSADGRFTDVTEYADDGYTVTFQKKVDMLPEDYWNGPRVLEERHYLVKDHSSLLTYSNIYNPDGTNTITKLIDGFVVEKAVWAKWHSVAGTTVTGYYPGTTNIRFSSKSDSSTDDVEFRRRDGTLSYLLSISNGHTFVKTFDKDGKQRPFEQYFDRVDKVVDGVVKSEYKLTLLTERDGNGKEKRRVDLWHQASVPDSENRFNVTVNGVKYIEIDSVYASGGTLETVRYYKNELKFPPDILETHLPSENIRMQLPEEATRLDLPNLDGCDLPIPPPRHGPGGR